MAGRTRGLKTALLGAAASLATGAAAVAQTQTPTEREVARSVEEVIVTAKPATPARVSSNIDSLGNISVLNAPVQISSFSAELLKNMDARSLDAVVKVQPGATTRTNDAQTGAYFQIRGFDAENVYFDGQPGLGGNNLLRTGVPVELFDSIQIVKGASSFLFGFAPPGGVLNYISKRPLDEPFLEINTGFASSSLFYGMVDGSISNESDTLGFRGVALHESGKMEALGAHLNRKAVSANLAAEVTPSTRASLDILYSDRKIGHTMAGMVVRYPLALGVIDPVDGATNFTPVDTGAHQTLKSANFTVSQDLGPDWTLRVNGVLASTRIALNTTLLDITSRSGDYTARNTQSLQRDNTRAIQFLFKGPVELGPLKNQLSIGGQLIDYKSRRGRNAAGLDSVTTNYGSGNIYTGVRNFGALPDYTMSLDRGYRSRDNNQNSVFISDLVEVTPFVSLLVGVRAIDYKNVAYNAAGVTTTSDRTKPVVPTYAAILKPTETVSIYGSYSESLQQGPQAGATASNAFEVLAPTRSTQYEAGVKWDFRGALFSAAIFRMDFPGAQCLSPTGVSNQPGCLFAYYGVQRHDGAEASVVGKFTPDLFVTAGVQYLKPTIRKDPTFAGKDPLTIPRWSGNIYVEYTPPQLEGFAVTAGMQYNGSSYYDAFNTEKLDGFTLFDLGARYTFEVDDKSYTVRARVDNIFNKKYFYSRQTLEPGNPRTFRASLTATF